MGIEQSLKVIELDHSRMMRRITTLSNEKNFCDVPGSAIFKLIEVNYDLLTADE